MNADGEEKYGKRLVMVRGDLYGKPRQFNRQRAASGFTTAEFRLDREMHDVFCALSSVDGTVPSRAVQEIREHRQHPWRVIARRFREAQRAGAPMSQLLDVVQVLNSYVASLYRETEQKRGA